MIYKHWSWFFTRHKSKTLHTKTSISVALYSILVFDCALILPTVNWNDSQINMLLMKRTLHVIYICFFYLGCSPGFFDYLILQAWLCHNNTSWKNRVAISKVGVIWLVWIFLDFKAIIVATLSASSYLTNVVIIGAYVGI